jgi:phosphohistidine phosphatase
MRIYLIHHGNAVNTGTASFEEDARRPLSVKGHDKILMVANGLKSLGVKPNLIISSPHLRSVQTAQILKKVLKCREKLAINPALVSPGNADDIIGEIVEKYIVDELLLVGYEPCLSTLIGTLAAGIPNLLGTMKYGGVCCLSIDDLRIQRVAILDWLLTPKILSRINSA